MGLCLFCLFCFNCFVEAHGYSTCGLEMCFVLCWWFCSNCVLKGRTVTHITGYDAACVLALGSTLWATLGEPALVSVVFQGSRASQLKWIKPLVILIVMMLTPGGVGWFYNHQDHYQSRWAQMWWPRDRLVGIYIRLRPVTTVISSKNSTLRALVCKHSSASTQGNVWSLSTAICIHTHCTLHYTMHRYASKYMGVQLCMAMPHQQFNIRLCQHAEQLAYISIVC